MTRLIDADGLKNKFWHGDLVPNKEMYHISEIMYAINNAPTVEEAENEVNFENKKETPTASKCRSDYEEGYARGFADGYERALRNTPTFPISTSPAHIVPDQLQGWRYEE